MITNPGEFVKALPSKNLRPERKLNGILVSIVILSVVFKKLLYNFTNRVLGFRITKTNEFSKVFLKDYLKVSQI